MTVYMVAYAQRYIGLSTDTKPEAGVMPGAVFIEVDTDSRFVYDGTIWQTVTSSW